MSLSMAEYVKIGSIGVSGDREYEMVKRSLSKNLNKVTGYLTTEARLAFTKFRKAFTKAPILWHFDLEWHIRIQIDASSYAIGGVLSQLTLDSLGQWHLIAFYSQKMILAKTQYKTHSGELLAIIKAFKTWRHYLEGCKHKILVLTNHNNLCCFMDTESLSSRQVCWAQELCRYYFRINYCQCKANGAADELSCFSQKN